MKTMKLNREQQRYLDSKIYAAQRKAADGVTIALNKETTERNDTPQLRALNKKYDALTKQHDRLLAQLNVLRHQRNELTKPLPESRRNHYRHEHQRIDAIVNEVQGRMLFVADYEEVMALIATIK